MADLPLNISKVPAQTAACKTSGNDGLAQQDAQEFGNILARQFADSAKTAESIKLPSGDAIIQLAKQDNTEITPADLAGSPPADMLAALLAQQNPTVTASPETSVQPPLIAQTSVNSSAAPDRAEGVSLALFSGNVKPSTPSLSTVFGTTPPKAESTINSDGLADTFKALAMKDSGLASNKQLQPGGEIKELLTSAQQPGISPLLPGNAAPSSAISISTPVTQPAWADEFSQKITWIATQRNQSAELHLNPPQLGPLDVVLKISGDQATATFASPHAAVREAIEQALPKLREMLAESGIMLGNAMVSDQTAKNNQDDSARKPQERTQSEAAVAAAESVDNQEIRVSTLSRHNGMVDTFA
jgi:flagellar hook-length control protein FliK